MPLYRSRNEKSSEVDFWDKDLCRLIDLEGLESSNRSGFFTSPEGNLTTQHTRKSAPPFESRVRREKTAMTSPQK